MSEEAMARLSGAVKRLSDGTYKVYRECLFSYLATKPDGSILASRMTLRGARRAIRRHRRAQKVDLPWRESPIVCEEGDNTDAAR